MSNVENFLELLATDPEQLPGVPSNQQIIEDDEELKKSNFTDLTPLVRSGYLEMWRFNHVREQIGALSKVALDALHDEAYSELQNPDVPERRADQVRFILNAVNSAHPEA